ncbi:MAG: hypothetical protein DWP95_06215 [Proteobacteria bacterium]|nr:MAG: hypothetical protein DWP95_06215 [Pseudomonadota bacterium]
MKHVKTILLILTGIFTVHTQQVVAAEFCATTSAGLEFVLAAAEANGQSDIIRIAEGSYDAPVGGFDFNSNENFDLTISGGWSEFFGNACGQQVTPDAFGTVLDGNGTERIMTIRVGQNSDIKVSNLFFLNGFVTGPAGRGGGLYLLSQDGYLGDVMIENNTFISNSANFGGALSLSRGYRIEVRNNLFTVNHAESGSAVEIVNNDAWGVYFTNNTVYQNTTDSTHPTNAGGLYLYNSGTSSALVANNIFWNNDNHDVRATGGGDKYFKYNDYQSFSGSFDEVTMNIQVAPEFESGWFNYTPVYNSPLVNGGTTPPPFVPIPPPFLSDWGVGTHDIYGNPRIQNAQIDIGAVESSHGDLIFIDGFE